MPTFGRTARLRPLAAFDSRLLALLDAVVWPGLIAAMVGSLSIQSGIVGTLTLALCVLFGVRRCVRALWHNERYQFTTWRCGLTVLGLLAIGAILNIVAP